MPGTVLGRLLRNRHADETRSVWHRPELSGPATLQLSSDDFQDNTRMPGLHSGKGLGENLSPALRWSAPPKGTEQLLFILEDIDVPLPRPMIHSAALLSAELSNLQQGELNAESKAVHFLPVLPAIFGRFGYQGPRPIPGHGPHRYRFQLFALDQTFNEQGLKLSTLLDGLDGHVLARGLLTGVQQQ